MTEIRVTANNVRELLESTVMQPTLYVDKDDNSIQIYNGVPGCFFDSYEEIITQSGVADGNHFEGTPDEPTDGDYESLAEWINTQIIPDMAFSINE